MPAIDWMSGASLAGHPRASMTMAKVIEALMLLIESPCLVERTHGDSINSNEQSPTRAHDHDQGRRLPVDNVGCLWLAADAR
eukprot:COSAG01_NODE_2783_length_7084_cov_242.792269_2_plen_82_part_00